MNSRISLGLQRISRFLQQIDNPQKTFDVIHVAGTNGKGSVSAMVANTLSRAGFKTGLYTSPHLAYRWDGISIDGQSIPRLAFHSLEKELRTLAQNSLYGEDTRDSLTTFEMMTATAFEAFSRARVDLAVVEVGLGGGEDATNVVSPLISVITSIGVDHTAYLGDDIKSIAQAKGGIIKAGVPVVVSSDQEHDQVFGVLGQIQRNIDSSRKIIWTPPNSTLDFRTSNQNTARAVLQTLRGRTLKNGSFMDPELLHDGFLEDGLRTTTWRGRYENLDLSVVGGPRSALLDGAHNTQSIEALSKTLAADNAGPRTYIFSLTSGKDPLALANLLRPGDTFITVEFEPVDGMQWIKAMKSSDILQSLSSICSREVKCIDFNTDLLGAIQAASSVLPESQLVICGSLYLVGQVHRLLESALYEQSFTVKQEVEGGYMGKYDPIKVEDRIRNYWESSPPVNPAAMKGPSTVCRLLLPPPNVTGSLHIGHALTIAIQDSWSRYYSATGDTVSWVPGLDHAGIATQSVVSRSLAKIGKDTDQLSRDEFVAEIWKWRDSYGARITQQIRRMGTTLDWNQEYFTMDEPRTSAVLEAFRRLWEAGLVKRENRIVNWSPKLQSVISDIEVDTRTVEEPTIIEGAEFGTVWRIRFELISEPGLTSSSSYIEVETTRPETIFGDRALAVHPEDDRYRHLIGSKARHPLLQDVVLDIVSDYRVSRDFGTGCVKLTPAHDSKDYLICESHKHIPRITVYDANGKMLPISGFPELEGLDRLVARDSVVHLLQDHSVLVFSRPHKTTLNICSRTGCIIEHMLLPQWYIEMKPLAAAVLLKNDITMTEQTRKEWIRWLTNVQDWCISRQLVWGHRIPLYRVIDTGSTQEKWVYGVNEAEARLNAGGKDVIQDQDVLDTWFSSGILPLSAFGWPMSQIASDTRLRFIESGPDILFFWLARMAMLCTFLSGETPFREIMLHPLIRDSQGRKMSKSLGNVIDPLSIIEGQSLTSMISVLSSGNLTPKESERSIKELSVTYPQGIPPAGSDALRFALVQSTKQSEALKFDIRAVMGGQYLCNKLWNAVNFYRLKAHNHKAPYSGSQLTPGESCIDEQRTVVDSWLIHQFNQTLQIYHTAFADRRIFTATECLRCFFVDTFCDQYLEFIKVELRSIASDVEKIRRLSLLRHILESLLKLYGVFMPYIAEDLWHSMDNRTSIHRQALPGMIDTRNCIERAQTDVHIDNLQTILKALRNIELRKSLDFTIHAQEAEYDALDYYAKHIQSMVVAKSVVAAQTNANVTHRIIPISPSVSVSYLATDVLSEGSSETKVTTAQKRLVMKLMKMEEMIGQKSYQSRVPEDVKNKHLSQIDTLRAQVATVKLE